MYQFLKDAVKPSSYVTMYHASISDETKEAVYADFVSGNLCLVSTNALGMVGLIQKFLFRGWIFQTYRL